MRGWLKEERGGKENGVGWKDSKHRVNKINNYIKKTMYIKM